MEARCSNCPGGKWQVRAEFEVTAENSGGDVATNIGLNAIGLGLLAATGAGFTAKIAGSSKAQTAISVAEVFDVDRSELADLCVPTKAAFTRIAAFVYKKEQAIQRERMKQRGGSNCKHCDILFVPSENKPWTLVGACSKSCCAALHGHTEYAQIESMVKASTANASDKIREAKVKSNIVQTQCSCGNEFSAPKMYAGTYRKCPHCGEKVLIPLIS
ncbi:MAG: hypothetical protein AAF483_08460 [Planctomycetota bacterium]